MNLNYIKTFYYTAKLGSLTNAAAYLDITQPAATRQLQELQNNVNLVLFDKAGKKYVLTDVGYILYGIAEKIVELEKDIEKNIKDYQNQKSGSIKISTTEGFGNYYLSEIIILFKKMFPLITVIIDINTSEKVYTDIEAMGYDIGFTDEFLARENSVLTKLIEEKFCLITNPASPLADLLYFTAEDINNIDLITLGKNSIEKNLIDEYLSNNNITVNTVCEVSSYQSLKNYVSGNLGAIIAPKYIVNNETASGKLVAIPEKEHTIIKPYYMVKHKDKFFNKPLVILNDLTMKWADFYSKGLLNSSNWN